MGYALIVGGGADGRYTISLDIGESERTALVNRFTVDVANAQAKLAEAQADLNEKVAALAAAAMVYDSATSAYIELLRGESSASTPDEIGEIVTGYQDAQHAHIRALAEHEVSLSRKNALSFSASHLVKALASWQSQVLTENREAWCADYTEDAEGYVATMEIAGESELILIAPGGRVPVLATDGYLRSRGLMSPWQAFFNAAVLPGWQKFKPTYRWGTITALDSAADTATVALADARSSAQRLIVNQAETLSNVQVVYMECNASAFEVGDRVVVDFQGQDWESPRVIGFLDTPRPCGFVCIGRVTSFAVFAIKSQDLKNKMWDPSSTFEWKSTYANTWQDFDTVNPDPDLAASEEPFRVFTDDQRSSRNRFDYGDPVFTPEALFYCHTKEGWETDEPTLPTGVIAILMLTVSGFRLDPGAEHIIELRVTLNGQTICNVAARHEGAKARTKGGINNIYGLPVGELSDYVLFTE